VTVTSELLPRLADYDWEPDAPVTTAEQLTAEVTWQVGFRDPAGRLGSIPITVEHATASPTGTAGCATVTPGPTIAPGLDLPAEIALAADPDPDPGSSATELRRVRVTPHRLTTLGTYLREGDDTGERRDLLSGGGTPVDVVSYAGDRTLVLTADGPVVICGISLPPAP
jgi:hypothetical protein